MNVILEESQSEYAKNTSISHLRSSQHTENFLPKDTKIRKGRSLSEGSNQTKSINTSTSKLVKSMPFSAKVAAESVTEENEFYLHHNSTSNKISQWNLAFKVKANKVDSANDDSYIINEQQSDEDNEEEIPGQS